MKSEGPPVTPDGRYILVRGRLWRAPNPGLSAPQRQQLINDLMDGRRAVIAASSTGDRREMRKARASVHQAKIGLGERGPVWWTDGSPDFNRHMARNTPYADWLGSLHESE
ncbi:hypothetical protein [Pseudoxanthomonas sp. GM95]|uniref:hypothetical protein n=1 Tax=Pseudoxanthomonas sp. GM95 TaxID=1881043 RepID=UPI000B8767ED|nr:hypothetical protein [Pseudoxanthomonas sp. GM95]